MNIIIIEDNPNISYITRTQLERKGHRIERYRSKEFNPFILKSPLYEVLIINTKVFEKHRKKINIYKRKKLLILGLSTRGGWQDRVEMLKAGADDVIGYPFPVQELEARIESLLRRPKNAINPVLKIGLH